MRIRHFRVVRVLRVVLAVARVLPRYLLLLARERSDRFRPDAAAWTRAHAAAAREVKRVALSLAGAFTKAAQVLGARADFLPAPFIDELSQFHDAVPPRPFATLAPLVERDLGRPLDAGVRAHRTARRSPPRRSRRCTGRRCATATRSS